MEIAALFIALTGIAATLALVGPALPAILRPRFLPQATEFNGHAGRVPRVSVIVPACNEQDAIRACLESLAQQDYPDFEIVAINDRSTDATGAVLDELAARHARLRVIHNRELPDGWLGKSHANHLGAMQADGEWLLFTDGDIIFAPDALRRAIAHVQAERLDHLSLMPGLIAGGYWESAMICFFGLAFCIYCKPWRIRDPSRPDAFCGIGAFNLVSRRAYEAIGTHRRLRLEVADDVKLGKLLKLGGFVGDVLAGWPLIRVRWHVGLRGVVRGLEKNAFCGADYRVGRALSSAMMLTAWAVVPITGILLAPGWWRLPFALWWAMQVLTLALTAARQGQSPFIGLAFPVACVALAVAILRSMFLTLYRGGVRWRGTFYPLADLRRELI